MVEFGGRKAHTGLQIHAMAGGRCRGPRLGGAVHLPGCMSMNQADGALDGTMAKKNAPTIAW
ncbi:hypothetical protein CEY11_20290 [Candidimonas nitroreducens]|uniref:Uncharacterized protein n=1 Tax=Candidimonas nitroreducens TaxID=683354 RepID=A0A225M2U5_9BURK|nr:hypothetical protein CEY11_20290 [Candidimonas nitroreducens]